MNDPATAVNGNAVAPILKRNVPSGDHDLPAMAEAWREFRQRYPKPRS